MKRAKLNNKGFSLVELIIVIAIMAILAAALAPQLMKYIEKSRIATDTSTCGTIESTVNTALGDEAIYSAVAALVTSNDLTFEVKAGGDAQSPAPQVLIDELKQTLSTLVAPKESGKTTYYVTIKSDNGKVGAVSCVTTSGSAPSATAATPATTAP